MFEKHLWKSDILRKDGGRFASKIHLLGLPISGILIENELINDYESSFYDMLSKLNKKMIHQR